MSDSSAPRVLTRTALLLLSFTLTACGGGGELQRVNKNNFDMNAEAPVPKSITPGTPWHEISVPLPPWPEEKDLIEFHPDGVSDSSLRYFIDSAHLYLNPTDQIVHYTLVAKSRTGATNVFAEGIRCTVRGTYKVYGYGANGKMHPTDDPQWKPIQNNEQDRYHDTLWRYHLCTPQKFYPRSVKSMLRSLRVDGNAPGNTGFQID